MGQASGLAERFKHDCNLRRLDATSKGTALKAEPGRETRGFDDANATNACLFSLVSSPSSYVFGDRSSKATHSSTLPNLTVGAQHQIAAGSRCTTNIFKHLCCTSFSGCSSSCDCYLERVRHVRTRVVNDACCSACDNSDRISKSQQIPHSRSHRRSLCKVVHCPFGPNQDYVPRYRFCDQLN